MYKARKKLHKNLGHEVVIVDHKKKTDAQKAKQSAAEFFSKSRMSIFGAMTIQSKMVEPELTYTYKFVDIVVCNTNSQDVKAVMRSFYALLQHIHTMYPLNKEVTLQSNCAQTFHGYGHVI